MPGSRPCHGSSRNERRPRSRRPRARRRRGRSSAAVEVARARRPGSAACRRTARRRRRAADRRCSAGDALRLAGQQPRAAHAVAADVHQRPALERGLQADVARARAANAKPRGSSAARRPRPRATSSRSALRLRMVAPHERLGEHAARALGQRRSASTTSGSARQRLLAQHVLAGLERRGATTARAARWAAGCRPRRRRGRPAAPRRSRGARGIAVLVARTPPRARGVATNSPTAATASVIASRGGRGAGEELASLMPGAVDEEPQRIAGGRRRQALPVTRGLRGTMRVDGHGQQQHAGR